MYAIRDMSTVQPWKIFASFGEDMKRNALCELRRVAWDELQGERQKHLLELAIEISLTSLGSSQIFLLPQLSTEAARRFCSFSDTISLP